MNNKETTRDELIEIIEIITRNAKTEFFEFRNKELSKEKEEIFIDCHKIYFFKTLYNFISNQTYRDIYYRLIVSPLTENALKLMLKEGTNFISLLYDYYLKEERTLINTWHDVFDLINDYGNKYGGDKNE